MQKTTVFLLLLTFCGCVKPTKPISPLPPETPASVPPPPLEKTFGETHIGEMATLHIQYKDINLLVDPFSADKSLLPLLDYLILTDGESRHFSEEIKNNLKKDIKVIATPGRASLLAKAGFSNVKGISTGQRVLLKKSAGFLFVSCVQIKNLGTGREVNGYVLEFDNGRNIFITGEMVDADSLREFLYSLRDDGKEIHMAYVYAGSIKSSNGTLQSADENGVAQIISLFQPKQAVVIQAQNPPGGASVKEPLLRQFLSEQIYSGNVAIARPGEKNLF